MTDAHSSVVTRAAATGKQALARKRERLHKKRDAARCTLHAACCIRKSSPAPRRARGYAAGGWPLAAAASYCAAEGIGANASAAHSGEDGSEKRWGHLNVSGTSLRKPNARLTLATARPLEPKWPRNHGHEHPTATLRGLTMDD